MIHVIHVFQMGSYDSIGEEYLSWAICFIICCHLIYFLVEIVVRRTTHL